MRLRTFGIFAGLVFSSACGDATGLLTMPGKYVMLSMDILDDRTGPNPIFSIENLAIDSLQDTVILKSDYTYQEVGAIWGHDRVGGTQEIRLDAHGTFTLDGSTITLIPDSGSAIPGGIGTLKKNQLVFDRSPARWTFSKR